MKLLQPKFPSSAGGRTIYFLRVVVRENGGGLVIKVTNRYEKEGKAIAVCSLSKKSFEEGYWFSTGPAHRGHRELCRLLRANGVRGFYTDWLTAVERGHGEEAGRLEELARICFECDLVEDEEAKGWKFDLGEEFAETEIAL